MKIGIVSLGCAKNRVDTELMLGLLVRAGHTVVTELGAAEAIIVNTCGFITPAKQESIDTILEMADYKEAGVCRALIVAGCLSERYKDELMSELPEVDAMMGAADLPDIVRVVERAALGEKLLPRGGAPVYAEGVRRVLTTPAHTAYVKLADGCDNRCSYCAIPLIRGSFKSRPMAYILDECEELLSRGVQEISLIAQDTTRWGDDLYGKPRFKELMRRVCDMAQGRWVRMLYGYVDRIGDDLLELLAGHESACDYLDMPIQHTDDAVLAAMNRRGTSADISRLYGRARDLGITLRTTVICGFPGETKEQHEGMLSFLRDHPFDWLGAFAYSPEEDTPAALMRGAIDEETAKARVDAVMRQQQGITRALNQERVGRSVRVLVESVNRARAVCRSKANAPEGDGLIYIKKENAPRVGCFTHIKLTRADDYDMRGELLNESAQ